MRKAIALFVLAYLAHLFIPGHLAVECVGCIGAGAAMLAGVAIGQIRSKISPIRSLRLKK